MASRLHYLPLPDGGLLTTEAARKWLEEWAGEWVTVLSHGCALDEKRTREDYAMLACDVRTMIEAAVEAIAGRAPVEFIRNESAEGLDAIARIIASEGEAFKGSTGPFEDCYTLLAEHLASRLEGLQPQLRRAIEAEGGA